MNYLKSVVSSGGDDRVEKFAASELARYASLITNKEIAVTEDENATQGSVYVGRLPANELKELHDDGFIIRNIGRNLVICGKTPRATLYGVYHYLQMLGVKWYFPGQDYEYVPRREAIELKPVDVKESPDIKKRGVVIHSGNSALADWIDFAPKVKLNTIAIHSHEGVDKVPEMMADRGLTMDLERHFFGAKYGSADPIELEENKRLVKDYVSNLPESITDFFLWQADGLLEQADYDKKRGYSISDSTQAFMNEILDAIRETRPSARLAFLAYASTWESPKNVKPKDGIFLEIAPIHRCFAHAIADENCPINGRRISVEPGEWRFSGIKPVIEDLLEVFDPAESQVLGYWLDASLFGRSRYRELRGRLPQFGEVIKDDINFYRNKGVSAITTFAVGLDREYFETFTSPTVFQYPALLWDSQIDLKPGLEDFCENFYGSKEMAAAFRTDEQIEPMEPMPEIWKAYISEPTDAGLLAQKVLNATDDDNIRKRLERLMNEFEFVKKWLDARN